MSLTTTNWCGPGVPMVCPRCSLELQEQETCADIAKLFGITVEAIESYNPGIICDARGLNPGLSVRPWHAPGWPSVQSTAEPVWSGAGLEGRAQWWLEVLMLPCLLLGAPHALRYVSCDLRLVTCGGCQVCVEVANTTGRRRICTKFEEVLSNDTCDSIVAKQPPPYSLLDLYRFNPGLNCMNISALVRFGCTKEGAHHGCTPSCRPCPAIPTSPAPPLILNRGAHAAAAGLWCAAAAPSVTTASPPACHAPSVRLWVLGSVSGAQPCGLCVMGVEQQECLKNYTVVEGDTCAIIVDKAYDGNPGALAYANQNFQCCDPLLYVGEQFCLYEGQASSPLLTGVTRSLPHAMHRPLQCQYREGPGDILTLLYYTAESSSIALCCSAEHGTVLTLLYILLNPAVMYCAVVQSIVLSCSSPCR